MATLTNGGTTTKKTMKLQTRLPITEDDDKVLGRTTSLRREKAAALDQVHTLKLKTHNSAWTPMVHKPSNEQIFKERRDLVSHWFDLWTDSQRKRFLDVVFRQCTRSQNKFVQDWFRERVPMQHLDFTTVLPRFLSLYIFSFLEPKSLCRCAQVSWNWKFLSEQDDVWMPKCVRLGWFLPYTPADNEYGAWKRHYVACIHTLDSMAGSKKPKPPPPGYPDYMEQPQMSLKSARLSRADSRRLMDIRPPWQGPDWRPKDLDQSTRALAHGSNPNEPVRPKSDLVMHNKWGILKTQHDAAVVTRSLDFEIGMDSKHRRDQHRALMAGEDLPRVGRQTLRESLMLQTNEEKRMEELVNTDWMPPTSSVMKRYPKPRHQLNVIQPGGNIVHSNPRIIIISSRVPAADLLLDAVLFGVIPIVYEYEGTVAQSLVEQVEEVLQGRHAQSVGLFCHMEEPGQLCLAHGCVVTLDNIDSEEPSNFFEAIANHILPADMGGQFDIFVPLAASEEGMEMMVKLSVKTSMQFSSPTGLIGNYNHVNSAWLLDYDHKSPPQVYFCTSKLQVWANVADQAKEAIDNCRDLLAPYFEKTHRDIVSQLTGQVIFDVLGQTDIQGVHDITRSLVEGLKSLGDQKNVNPLDYMGRFLLQKASGGDQDEMASSTMSRQQTLTSVMEQDELHTSKSSMSSRRQVSRERSREGEEEEDVEGHPEEGEEEEEGNTRAFTEEEEEREELAKYAGEEKASKEERNQRQRHLKTSTLKTQELSTKFGTMRATKTKRLTAGQFADHPEKRTPIAFEVLASEQEYMRTLKAISDVYVRPLKSALASNRAIISGQNIQIIFTDVMNIFKVSRELTEDLQNRLADWDPQHTCLGDIFIKFCTRVKVYTNFTNNYEVILRCIERCKEQSPAFRAFLERHERVPETRMLTLQEMLLLPVRRIGEYVMLLTWFEFHTPRTHADRQDLSNAIATLTELHRGMKECRVRMEREKQLVQLTRKIINCPALLEANRYLIKHLDVTQWKAPSPDTVVPELRVFQQIATLGLYLFNDALVITKRTSKHFPFSRAIEYTYKFETSLALTSMQVVDMPDSKYVKNAFRMTTHKRDWVCSAGTSQHKYNWVALLEKTIRGAIRQK